MTTLTQQDAASMFYPFNPCGHLRSPGGGCIGVPEDFPGARLMVAEKLGSVLSLAECFNALIVSLLDDRGVLALEDMVSLGKIGGNVVR